MLNRYPLWKNIMLMIVIIGSIIYALPNLYGDDPALQITKVHGTAIINNKIISKIQNILKNNNIQNKVNFLKNGTILVRLSNTDTQLNVREILSHMLGSDYIVALALEPATPYWLRYLGAEPMKLGLDLRGGVHFLLEVDVNSILNKLQTEKIDSICNELNKKTIHYVKINKINHYGLEIKFSNDSTRNKALEYLQSLNHDLYFSIASDSRLRAVIFDTVINKTKENVIQQNINIIRNRVNQLGVSESIVQRQGLNYIIVELPGIQDTARAKAILGATATLEFHLVNTNLNSIDVFNGHIPSDSEVKITSEGHMTILYKNVILTGNHIINASSSIDEYNQPQVNIELDDIGGNIMSNFTRENIGKPMATLFVEYESNGKKDVNGRLILVKQEKVINIANIQSYLNKNFRIVGIKDKNEAHQLSFLLRTGALIAPIQIIEERIIGPTLGQQNIKQGMEACLYGFIASVIFMICFYKYFGLIATSALLCNLVLIISIMSIVPGTTLTMPGIAGILLTIAVAVDANVLINERIKEELQNGRSVQQAIYAGYKGAYSSILDANITTLIKVIILYTVGTSSIKGFAITTAIGIATSMFTSIIGTRAVVNFIYGGKYINKISI
ncbi:protein translocase subunit SecD [Pantoea sp. Mhis]|uniref:protein translocase subunit SecD n=1 Tax=Pantoea sp. Mhis TaxID=2576759 RepID=UPI001358E345|nr:protein translocase subunit SecD [Pantoea sp. Mhis]MXP56231.1 protein translocase subunit SecD [Pantoea sp. Mhis]